MLFNLSSTLFTSDNTKALFSMPRFEKRGILQVFAHLFTNNTTTVNGTRYLVNEGEGDNAVMYTGQGVYSNGIDNELLVSGYIAQYIHWKDGVFTVTEINNTVTDYNLISAAGNYQWALLTNTTLTTTELSNIEQNPELALYWDNGVLTSDYFDTAKVFEWYPFTENVSAGGYRRNHALAMPSNMFDGSFDVVQSDWIDNLDGSYTSTGGTGPSNQNLQEPNLFTELSSYILEVEVFGGSAGQLGYYNGTVNIDFTSGDGYKRILATTSANRTMFALNCESGFTGSIRNIKVYPLANSGLTPLTNWTETTTTNASQLTTGFQTALFEQDSFGLPISLKNYNIQVAEGGSLIDLNNAANPQGLNFVDNAGTLEVYKQ